MTMYKTISYYEIILIGYFSIRNVYELGSQHFLFSVSSLTINKSFAKVCAIQHKRVLMRVLLPDISRDPHTCTRYVTIVLKLKCPLENQNHFKEFLWLWKFYIEVTSEITFANIFILFLSKHILICKFSFSKKECEKFFFLLQIVHLQILETKCNCVTKGLTGTYLSTTALDSCLSQGVKIKGRKLHQPNYKLLTPHYKLYNNSLYQARGALNETRQFERKEKNMLYQFFL